MGSMGTRWQATVGGHMTSPGMLDPLPFALFWCKLVKSTETIRKYIGVAIVIITVSESLRRASPF